MADPAALWGLGGTVGGVLLAEGLRYLSSRGVEDRGQLHKSIEALGVEMRSSHKALTDDVDELRESMANTRETVAGIAAVVNGLVIAPLDPRPRRPRGG